MHTPGTSEHSPLAVSWRLSGRWYATLLVLAALFANNRLLLDYDPTGNWPAGAPRGNLGQPVPPSAYAVWRDGNVVCVNAENIINTDRFIGYIGYAYRERTSSLATAATNMEGAVNYTIGGAAADPALVRQAFIAWLAKDPNPYWQETATRLAAQPTPGFSIRWRALARLLANLVLIALLIRSLAWTIPVFDALGRSLGSATMTPAERAAARRKLALKKGLCPACAYDIRGLPARICPECSHRWTDHERATIPAR